MPIMQGIIERLNVLLNRKNLEHLDADLVAPGQSLAAAARAVGAVTAAYEQAFIESWPSSLQEVIRAALYSAATRKPRIPVTFSWTPGYDFEVSVWEAPGTRRTIGGITIQVRSRYPD